MLAHLKTKGREPNKSADSSAEGPDQHESSPTVSLASASLAAQVECPTTKLTCDALCSLSCAPPSSIQNCRLEFDSSDEKRCPKKGVMGCPKQEHQLPMFLSSKSCFVKPVFSECGLLLVYQRSFDCSVKSVVLSSRFSVGGSATTQQALIVYANNSMSQGSA
jgi:hypothetical protein